MNIVSRAACTGASRSYLKRSLDLALGSDIADSVLNSIYGDAIRPKLARLQWASPKWLAERISQEHVRMQTVFLAFLPPALAGQVIGALPAGTRDLVLVNLARLNEVDHELLVELDELVERCLASLGLQSTSVAGVRQVAEILNRLPDNRAKMVEVLRSHDAEVVAEIERSMYDFFILSRQSEATLLRIMEEVPVEQWAIALKGAEPAVRDSIIRAMPRRQAQSFEETMRRSGPCRAAGSSRRATKSWRRSKRSPMPVKSKCSCSPRRCWNEPRLALASVHCAVAAGGPERLGRAGRDAVASHIGHARWLSAWHGARLSRRPRSRHAHRHGHRSCRRSRRGQSSRATKPASKKLWRRFERLSAPVTEMLEALKQMQADYQTAMRKEVIELVAKVARQVIRKEIQMQPMQLLALVDEALSTMPRVAADEIAVYLNPQDLERIIELDPAQAERWNLWADDKLELGECRVKAGTPRSGCRLQPAPEPRAWSRSKNDCCRTRMSRWPHDRGGLT